MDNLKIFIFLEFLVVLVCSIMRVFNDFDFIHVSLSIMGIVALCVIFVVVASPIFEWFMDL